MGMKRRAVALGLISSIGIAIILFFTLFDRYNYYDYSAGACKASSVELVASLVGSFRSDHPRKRASPYYLRVEVVGGNKDRVTFDKVELISSKSKKRVDLHETKQAEIDEPGASTSAVVYLADSLWLDYDDYVLGGVVVKDAAKDSGGISFTCSLNRSRRHEWRIPLWDALMSV